MEGEVCMFNKFGFCKFQSECKREHYSEVCDQLSRCSNIKICKKDIPQIVKDMYLEMAANFVKTVPITTMWKNRKIRMS